MTAPERARAAVEAEPGLTSSELADRLGCSTPNAWNLAKRAGLKKRMQREKRDSTGKGGTEGRWNARTCRWYP